MTVQLDLFSDKTCYLCGKNPGPKQNNPLLWNGFKDMETGQYIGYCCRKTHYGIKSNNGTQGFTMVEYPVYALGRI